MNDGVLQAKYKEYVDRLSFIKSIGLSDRETQQGLMKDMSTCVEQMSMDIAFIAKGKDVWNSHVRLWYCLELQQRNSEYCQKQDGGKASEKTMMSLSWDLKQLDELDEEG